jgi:hypothetical protein
MDLLVYNMCSRKIPHKIKDFYLSIPGYAIRPGSCKTIYHRSGVNRICHLVDKMIAAEPGAKVILYFDSLDERAHEILRASLDNEDVILCCDYSQIVPDPYIYLIDTCGPLWTIVTTGPLNLDAPVYTYTDVYKNAVAIMTPEEQARLDGFSIHVVDGPSFLPSTYISVISKHKPKDEYFHHHINYLQLPGGTRTRDECRYCGYRYCERPCHCGSKRHCDNTHPCKYCLSTDCGLFENGVYVPRCQLCELCYRSSHSTEDCPEDSPICNICKLCHTGDCLLCTWCQEYGHVIKDCLAWHCQLDLEMDAMGYCTSSRRTVQFPPIDVTRARKN